MKKSKFSKNTNAFLILILLLFTSTAAIGQDYKINNDGADSVTINFLGTSVRGFYRGSYLKKLNSQKGFYPHGQGSFYAKVNNTPSEYTGVFFEGTIAGVGEIKGGNWNFKGAVSNGMANGDGKLFWYVGSPDGVKSIKGNFKDGKANGNVLIEYTNSAYYMGDAVNGNAEGIGELHFEKNNPNNFELITGYFKNGKPSGKVEIKYTNNKLYKGEFTNEKYNGLGKLENYNPFSKVNTYKEYEGYWMDGQREGNGYTIYHNGEKLEGLWKLDLFYGIGKRMLDDSSLYDGEWKASMPNGKGIQTTKYGSYCSGDFENGKFTGKGKWVDKHGNIYEGDYVSDKKQGQGIEKIHNGNIYEGEYFNNYLVNGTKKYPDGTYESGVWNEKNEFTGKAKHLAGNKSIWEGDWQGLLPAGKGKVTFENGNIYDGEWTGQFENNYYSWYITGQGIMKYQNGDVYTGSWFQSVKNGQGKMTFKDGSVYTGQWKNDNMNGDGELINANKTIQKGKFVNGVYSIPYNGIYSGPTVKIGNQIWMQTNLNVALFLNGDTILEVKTMEECEYAMQNKIPAWCYANNDPANGSKYGKLYNWYAVTDPRGLAPKGWHLPSEDEFQQLNIFTSYDTGKKLKSKTGWSMGVGTDIYGFSALPGGMRLGGDYAGNFYSYEYVGEKAFFWSSTNYFTEMQVWENADEGTLRWEKTYHNYFLILSSFTGEEVLTEEEPNNFYSVRCIKN